MVCILHMGTSIIDALKAVSCTFLPFFTAVFIVERFIMQDFRFKQDFTLTRMKD